MIPLVHEVVYVAFQPCPSSSGLIGRMGGRTLTPVEAIVGCSAVEGSAEEYAIVAVSSWSQWSGECVSQWQDMSDMDVVGRSFTFVSGFLGVGRASQLREGQPSESRD